MNEAQMTPFFSGRCLYTRRALAQANCAAARGAVWLIRPLAGLILLAGGLMLVGPGTALSVLAAILLFLGAAFFLLYNPVYLLLGIRRQISRLVLSGQENMDVTLQFFPRHFTLETSLQPENCIHFGYDHVTNVTKTRRYLILWMPMDMYWLLDKTRVEGGTADELIAFLKEKNPNIRMR